MRLLQERARSSARERFKGRWRPSNGRSPKSRQLPGATSSAERIQAAIAAEARQREQDEAAQVAVGGARKLALAGQLADAIALLERADTSHAAVATALTDLRRDRSEVERREREQREQDEKRAQARKSEIAALLKRARKAKSPDAAIALLRSVLELDPDNADAQDALAKYQEQRKAPSDAAGIALPPRSTSLWTIGGVASAIVALIVVATCSTNVRQTDIASGVQPGSRPLFRWRPPPQTTVPSAAPLRRQRSR